MEDNKPELNISISREHKENLEAVKEAFKGFDVHIDAGYMRFSEGDLPMQIFIFISKAFIVRAAWDLFKIGIKKIYEKFPKARLVIRDKDSIMYTVKVDFTVNVIVVPDRWKEFEDIKTLDDVIEHLKSKDNINDAKKNETS